MAVAKKRVNLTLDKKTYTRLKDLSKHTNEKPSTLGLELIKRSLDEIEDIYFSKEGDKRLAKSVKKSISHEDIWS